jgi:Na+-transporting methylmalonyl-CoA/oxaloacetate decarboxylase gamma subunit
MAEAVQISIAGILGVMAGIFLLYLTVRVTGFVTDGIEKRKKEKEEKQKEEKTG